MDLSRVDRVVLTEDQMGKIAGWEQDNHERFKPNFALTEAVIEVTHLSMPFAGKYEMYYKLENDYISFKVFLDNELWYHFDYNKEMDFVDRYLHPSIGKYGNLYQLDDKKLHASAVLNIVAVNAYMVYFDGTDFLNEVEDRIIVKKKAKHSSGSSKKTRHVVRLHKQYNLIVPEDLSDKKYKPTKDRQRHTEGWTVRGHYRFNPRTGEKDIWIPPYPKGNLRNITAKEYHI